MLSPAYAVAELGVVNGDLKARESGELAMDSRGSHCKYLQNQHNSNYMFVTKERNK